MEKYYHMLLGVKKWEQSLPNWGNQETWGCTVTCTKPHGKDRSREIIPIEVYGRCKGMGQQSQCMATPSTPHSCLQAARQPTSINTHLFPSPPEQLVYLSFPKWKPLPLDLARATTYHQIWSHSNWLLLFQAKRLFPEVSTLFTNNLTGKKCLIAFG